MTGMRHIVKPLIPFLIVAFFNLTVHAGPAGAALVGTESVLNHVSAPADRARVLAFFEREDVSRQIRSLGISAEEAKARVASLSDSEIARVAGELDKLPAGGDMGIVGAVLLIFVILLFTDILGLTHIFPAISGKR